MAPVDVIFYGDGELLVLWLLTVYSTELETAAFFFLPYLPDLASLATTFFGDSDYLEGWRPLFFFSGVGGLLSSITTAVFESLPSGTFFLDPFPALSVVFVS